MLHGNLNESRMQIVSSDKPTKARHKAPRRKTAGTAPTELRSVRFTVAAAANSKKFEQAARVFGDAQRLKHEMSVWVHANRTQLLTDVKELLKTYKRFQSQFLNAWERQQMFAEVVGAYQQRLTQVMQRGAFVLHSGWRVSSYKRVVTFKNGTLKAIKGAPDPQTFDPVWRETPLRKAATYLLHSDVSRFEGNLAAALTVCTAQVRGLLAGFVSRPELWQRLLQVVKARQSRLLGQIKLQRFTSGTHRRNPAESRSRVVCDSTNAKWQWFYEMRVGVGRGAPLVRLPLTFKDSYLRPDAARLAADHFVMLRRGKLSVVLTREAPALQFADAETPVVVGLDVNTKHNLFALSNGEAVPHDAAQIQRLVRALKPMGVGSAENLTHRQRARLAKCVRANEAALERKISETLDKLEGAGATDVVMEDLDGFKASLVRSSFPDAGGWLNRKLGPLRLSSIKNLMRAQAEKRGIRVHCTHAAYTSQQCPECGHISSTNQEPHKQFKCEVCGYSYEADFVAARNIARRIGEDVLRQALHEFDAHGRGNPKSMRRSLLKRVLLGTSKDAFIDTSASENTHANVVADSRSRSRTVCRKPPSLPAAAEEMGSVIQIIFNTDGAGLTEARAGNSR